MSRWDALPGAAGREDYVILGDATTTSSVPSTTVNIKQFMGEQIHASFSAYDNQWICQYKNLVSDSPISYLCEVGCCPNGCCTVNEIIQTSSTGYALGLLIIFILVIIAALILTLSLYLYNKYTDKQAKKKLPEPSLPSSTSSQISAPSSSYYGQETIYSNFPHQMKNHY
uniref:CX domain-containing protein n=1 Tax=Parastrongyloides trichosuri TaxID=131310 RepID=A0A0N4Z4X4_PARTI